MQTDINEVNKLAHELKGRLERLQKNNEASLGRKVLLCSLRHTFTAQRTISVCKVAHYLWPSQSQCDTHLGSSYLAICAQKQGEAYLPSR